uniref:Zinc finger protein n=1 Tax=Panagrolaimus davidi TaxID=227884 RepID=A0A914PBR5_9BILA
MLTHVRAVRFRCALCDVGAFYCEDMRSHLMNRNCPSLHLVPDKYQGTAIPCMTAKESDELTQIVHQEFPGQFRYTSGKIVTSDNPVPHRPDAKIEESILNFRPPYIPSPIKERPKILSRSNKSPSRLVPVSDSTNVSTPTKSTTTQNETRIVTPLKLVRNKNSEAYDTIASSSTSSKLKLPGFKLLKPASPTNSETLETAPNVEEAAASESSDQPSTSAPLTIQEPPPAIPPSPPAADEEIVEPEHEHIPPVPSPLPEQQEPEEPNDDTEPLDPIQPAGPHLIGRRSIDPVDPS